MAQDCALRFINGDERAISLFTTQNPKIPRKSQIQICEFLLEKSSRDIEHPKQWSLVIKQWSNHDAMQEALTNWISEKTENDSLGDNASVVIADVISANLVDPCSLESLFKDGKFHPTFFLILKELFDSMGILYIQRKFGMILK